MLSADSITPSSRKKIICLCKDPDEGVQDAAVEAVLKLSKGDNTLLPIMDIIIDMLGNSKLDEKGLFKLADAMMKDCTIHPFKTVESGYERKDSHKAKKRFGFDETSGTRDSCSFLEAW
ncbi:hypothetical protein B0H14DRAFT_2590860 [Mycena olivaceomarginata]|nr:hypothetical protein B0H14DRAFT_2590860 [Mycena olivaceomarginata]